MTLPDPPPQPQPDDDECSISSHSSDDDEVVQTTQSVAVQVLFAYLTALGGDGKPSPPWLDFSVLPNAQVSLFLSSTALIVLSCIDHYGFANHGVDVRAFIPALGATAAVLGSACTWHAYQPRTIIVAYLISSITGVCCNIVFRQAYHADVATRIGAAFAVCVSASVMKLVNCVHPPAGSAAVLAALGVSSNTIRDEGFLFVIAPVLLGVVVILTFAFLGSNMCPTREHYPKYW